MQLKWTALPLRVLETPEPGCSWGSMFLLQLGAVLMSVTPFTIKGTAETRALDQNISPYQCLKVMWPLWPFRSEYPLQQPGAMVTHGPELGPCLGS